MLIIKLLRKLLLWSYLSRKIRWLKLWRLHDRTSNRVLLLAPSFPRQLFKYCLAGDLVSDLALCNALINQGQRFRIVFGKQKLNHIRGAEVFHNLSRLYTGSNEHNYSNALLQFQKSLLSRNNRLVPCHEDSMLWENKIPMHQKFTKLEIPHPKSYLVDSTAPAPPAEQLAFPILFKPAHSAGSKGIEKINSPNQYRELLRSTDYAEFIVQEWIDMRSDLRLIYIGDELVLHYWRINNEETWRPTSTSFGSSVDFANLPEKWMPFIFEQYKKLNMMTGAFDITWRNDDLSTEPLILEVSPSYMPNPKPVGKYMQLPYSQFKKCIFGSSAYYKHYVDLVFETKLKLIEHYKTIAEKHGY